jgi:hypothetical protein
MTDSAALLHSPRRRPPALAIWSLALAVAPFVLVAIGGSAFSVALNFVIPPVWIASIVVGIVAAIAPLGRWRLAGILAIVAPAIEAIFLLVLITFAFSTI